MASGRIIRKSISTRKYLLLGATILLVVLSLVMVTSDGKVQTAPGNKTIADDVIHNKTDTNSTIVIIDDHSIVYTQTNYYSVASSNEGEIPYGTSVTVTATTDDPNVKRMTFKWRNAAGIQVFNDAAVQEMVSDGARTAASVQQPNSAGDWNVEVLFLSSKGEPNQRITVTLQVRMYLNVIPEIPLLGTASSAIAMTLGLAYTIKKKTNN